MGNGKKLDEANEAIKAQLIRDEGFKLKPYRCTSGKLTIGVGRNLDDKGISREEALYLLQNDVDEVREDLVSQFPWMRDLDEARFGAFVNLAFNMGIGGLKTFVNTLQYARHGHWDKVAVNLLKSKYASQVGDRAKRIAKQLETGEWQ